MILKIKTKDKDFIRKRRKDTYEVRKMTENSSEFNVHSWITRIKQQVISTNMPICIEAKLTTSKGEIDSFPIWIYAICVYRGEILAESIELFKVGDGMGNKHSQRLHMQMTIYLANYMAEILSFQLIHTVHKVTKEIKMDKEVAYLTIPEGFILK